MVCKRLLGTAVLFMLLTFSASASTVSFLVVETGLHDGFASPQSSSRLWEEGLMAFFFDSGHIGVRILKPEKVDELFFPSGFYLQSIVKHAQ